MTRLRDMNGGYALSEALFERCRSRYPAAPKLCSKNRNFNGNLTKRYGYAPARRSRYGDAGAEASGVRGEEASDLQYMCFICPILL